jgi:hypothetical protein
VDFDCCSDDGVCEVNVGHREAKRRGTEYAERRKNSSIGASLQVRPREGTR